MKGTGGKRTLGLGRAFDRSSMEVCAPTEAPYTDEPTGLVKERLLLSNPLAIIWRFFLAGLIQHAQTGAVVPSQRFLIKKMLAPVPPDFGGQVLELGAGTGALTLRLAEKCPGASVVACEINPVLARDVETQVSAFGLAGQVQVICNSAENILSAICEQHLAQPDFIISGIPLGNLPDESALALIDGVRRALPVGGMYIQFQHSLLDRRKIKLRFSRMRTAPVLLNFPPAFVYYAQK